MLQGAKALQNMLAANRQLFDDLVKRKFIFCQTAEIYGGVAGLYDYGPIGTGIKNNLIQLWKSHFIVEEDLLEVSCTTLTPQVVLKHSGHEERFIDYMVKDEESKESFRADHLLEDFIERELKDEKTAPAMREELDQLRRGIPNFKSAADFDAAIEKYGLKNPVNKKGKLSKAFPFNLMFDCKIGPLGDQKAYLRPETAQSIFCNFKKLLEFNNGKLPFGASIVGSAYRNEIAPRNGLLRVREFEMAEIEFFVDPDHTRHAKFESIKGLAIPVFSRQLQETGAPEVHTIEDILKKGIMKNETLAYFIGRTFLFAKSIGLKEEMLRFRQHQKNEMAHYASDCWDLEVLTSYGWVECVGLADRAAYDLSAHTKGSGEKLVASRKLDKPTQVSIKSFVLDKGAVAKAFKEKTQRVAEEVDGIAEDQFDALHAEFEKNGSFRIGEFTITKEMVKQVKTVTKNVQEQKFVPNVIEPSFGIGRLVYAVLEHCFAYRNDKKRTFFAFKAALAPYKVIFLPLMGKPNLNKIVDDLVARFRKAGISCRADAGSSAIGRRYARTDEVGIPFAVTVDFQTVDDGSVTLREIHSMEQVRIPGDQLLRVIKDVLTGEEAWTTIQQKFPKATVNEDDKDSKEDETEKEPAKAKKDGDKKEHDKKDGDKKDHSS